MANNALDGQTISTFVLPQTVHLQYDCRNRSCRTGNDDGNVAEVQFRTLEAVKVSELMMLPR